MIKQKFMATIQLCLCLSITIFEVHVMLQAGSGNFIGTATSTRVIVVPDNFTKIQDAINNAVDGETVLVRAGIYNESLTINCSISLISLDKNYTIINGHEHAHVITVSVNNVTIKGFNIISGELGKLKIRSGVYLDNVDFVSARDNIITGNFIGIFLGDQNRGSHRNIIENNQIFENRYGIFMAHSDYNIICGNIISNSLWNGIELDWCHRNVIHGNVISNNTAFGLEMPLQTPSKNNVVFHNNFINNTPNVCVSKYVNTWIQEYPFGGNYWSDYKGLDNFNGQNQTEEGADGLGDTGYHIDKNNKDSYPLISPVFTFRTVRINRIPSYIYVISNSTISDFCFYPDMSPILKFNITAENEQGWFCRVTIPKFLLWSDNGWSIYVDNEVVESNILEDLENTYIFLVYTFKNDHTKTITVIGTGAIPEFKNFNASLLTVLTITLIIIMLIIHSPRKGKHEKSRMPIDWSKINIFVKDVHDVI